MQCEGFKPDCANTAEYTIKGYRFCLSCFRDFAGYSPEEQHKLIVQPTADGIVIGRVYPDYYAQCGRCQYGFHPGEMTKASAEKSIKESGWKKTRAYGWVCPDCAKKRAKED